MRWVLHYWWATILILLVLTHCIVTVIEAIK